MLVGSATRTGRKRRQRVPREGRAVPSGEPSRESGYWVLGTGYPGTRYWSGSSVGSTPPPDHLVQAAPHRVSREHRISHCIGEPRAAHVDALMLKLVEVAAGFDVAAQEARQVTVVRLDDRQPLVRARCLEA